MNNWIKTTLKKCKWLNTDSLQRKIFVATVGINVIIVILIVFIVASRRQRETVEVATAQMGIIAENFADEIRAKMSNKLFISRTLASVAQSYAGKPNANILNELTAVYSEVIEVDPEVMAVWDSWELSYLDPNYGKDYGRVRNVVWREAGVIRHSIDTASLSGDSEEFARIKRDGVECLDEPYLGTYGASKEEFIMTSVFVPFYIDAKLAGIVGVDVPLANLNAFIQNIKPYPNSHAFLVSNSFKYIAHPNPDLIGKDAHELYGDLFEQQGALNNIYSGNPAFFSGIDNDGEESYFVVRPITVGNSKMSWALVLVVPEVSITHTSNVAFYRAILVGLIGVVLIGLSLYFTLRRYVIKPVKVLTQCLQMLSVGANVDVTNARLNRSNDELGKMADYLTSTIEGLEKKSDFAKEIGAGNYSATLNLLGSEDTLGKSLIDMGTSLRKAQEDVEKRRAEDAHRQWINEGLANFGAILRQDNNDLKQLAINITRNLVEYLGANQGGLFILNSDNGGDPSFEQLASFAYNRQKFIQKNILWGEGLIGTCAIEKQTIYLTNIPENYITISSGLGEAKPRSLLIVPLNVDDNVLGMLELASFHNFDSYQIDFVEKVAQSIAQTLMSARATIQTAELLSRTQQQTEEMKAQEEEVRQNLEEMEAIKEELEKRNSEIVENQKKLEWENTLLDSILNFLPDRIYFKNLKSQFLKVSASTLKGFGLDRHEELEGKTDFDFFDEAHAKPAYRDEQRIIETQIPMLGVVEREVYPDGSVTWAETSKLPLRNNEGQVVGTFGITRDITNQKVMEEEVMLQKRKSEETLREVERIEKNRQYLFDAITNSNFVIEYDTKGYITYINEAYTQLLGLTEEEVIGKHHSYSIDFTEEQQKNYNAFWEDLNKGIVKRETQKYTVNSHQYLFHETYSPILDNEGRVCKIIKIAVNVSHLIEQQNG